MHHAHSSSLCQSVLTRKKSSERNGDDSLHGAVVVCPLLFSSRSFIRVRRADTPIKEIVIVAS